MSSFAKETAKKIGQTERNVQRNAKRGIAARKEVYERLHPETRTGGAPGKAGGGKKVKNAKTASFVEETAQKTGKKKRTVARSATRGKRGKTWLAQITGTCLDKGDEIDALIGLQPAPPGS